nr:LysR family transcriptional regulator [Microbacterium flavescens]
MRIMSLRYDSGMSAFDDPDLDPQVLRVVKAVADAGSITGAAAALGYSQPAISQQLKRLERRLGVPLVERVGRSVRLTEAGRILARHAPAVTTALDAAAGELAELRGLRAGRVRLVGFPSASPTIVPRLLAELEAGHAGVTVTYLEAEPPEAVVAVREDRADIALTFSYPGDRDDPHGPSARGLSVRTVGTDDLLAVLPAGHREAGTAVVDVAGLAGRDGSPVAPAAVDICWSSAHAPGSSRTSRSRPTISSRSRASWRRGSASPPCRAWPWHPSPNCRAW